MDKQKLLSELKEIIGNYLKQQQLELVELISGYQGRDLSFRVLIDRPEGGITLDECAEQNILLGNMLEQSGIIQERYILEVSSPGLDRPLSQKRDFLRCLNRQARFFLLEAVDKKIELEGRIEKIEDDAVYINSEGKLIKIPFPKIRQAKQIIS